MTTIEWEFIDEEQITAGNKTYVTDRVSFTPPFDDCIDSVEVNHVEMECPNCRAIGELAIELRTNSLVCPICEHRVAFDPESHLAAGVEIGDQPTPPNGYQLME